MQILKETGIDWKERKKEDWPVLYMDQSVERTTRPRGDEKCEEWMWC
jgi:hypothetical protein